MHKFLALIIILFTNLSIAQDSRMDANEIKAFKENFTGNYIYKKRFCAVQAFRFFR